jgi:hypothetical protein
MDSLSELAARESEVEREWQWLHDTLNKVARARADQAEIEAFRLMQQQAMTVGMRRVELRLKRARLEAVHRPGQCNPGVTSMPHPAESFRQNGGTR